MTSYPPPPDPLAAAARYTTVDDVKLATGIDAATTTYDAEILQAVITIEYLIDVWLDTSFPQDPDPNAGTDDALDPPPIEGIPEAVKYAALTGAIKTFKLLDLPFGTGGADEFVGAIEFGTASRRAFNEIRPLLLGLKRGWGLA